ncbi:hypothetical protein CDAR_369281 [Caerostris darwini]|uniref:Uncharacterized protein n=1 Tax=Caerostris darwini TaxID=1538125 RepID=A0AAV4RUY5_9ARAC|nr:hypothetical protein CDAR_369281 [Caerostris darwini]
MYDSNNFDREVYALIRDPLKFNILREKQGPNDAGEEREGGLKMCKSVCPLDSEFLCYYNTFVREGKKVSVKKSGAGLGEACKLNSLSQVSLSCSQIREEFHE